MTAAHVNSALDALHEVMKVGYTNGDAVMIADQFYSQDAWVVGPESAVWKGRGEVLALYETVVGVYEWETERKHLVQLSDGSISEFLIGRIVPVKGGETLSYKIQLVWQKVNDQWRCVSQFFASGTTFDPA
ncbi:hypothetical protein [Pseudomonas sp. Teo4]|uniref:hypothetical protein n=1 Tax=Pseudomonas sp. Teo4 TaxID=3064528 RepID=UPI002ABB211D|nr:hypothetical protein [Pseudomonas sp. Teo4]MDZ3992561.1 hypothetical protein [Pseudomonas sp. Teo4]